MSDAIRKPKLADAVPNAPADDAPLDGMPEQNHATSAEQTREAEESRQAHNAQAGQKDRLVDIGKAGHMGGRGGGRVSDS